MPVFYLLQGCQQWTGHGQELHYSFCLNLLLWIQVAVSALGFGRATSRWGGERGHRTQALAGLLPPASQSPPPPTAPLPPRGHYFESREWESPILKLSAIFLFFVRPSAARGSLHEVHPFREPSASRSCPGAQSLPLPRAPSTRTT